MTTWKRRSILATCAALSTGGALASAGSTAAKGAMESVGTSSSSVGAGDPPGWSSALGNAANSRYLPLDDEFPKPDTEAWRYDEAALPASRSLEGIARWNIAVVDGMVYVGTDGGELLALEADEGTVAWRTDIEVSSRPTVLSGTIYLTGENHVTALDAADGTVEWDREFDAGDSKIPSPTAAYGAVYVVAGGSLYALEADDGSTRWDRDEVDAESSDEAADGDSQPRPFQAEPVAAGHGSVYAMTETDDVGGIAALDGETGDDVWVLEGIDDVRSISTIVVTSDRVFTHHHMVTDDVDKVYHHDPETGELGFSEESYLDMLEIAAAPDHCVTIGREQLIGYEYGAGEQWAHSERAFGWLDYGGCIIAGDTVIATVSSFEPETIIGFDLEDGTEQWSLESPLGSLVAVDERTIYIIEDRDLVALRASDADQDGGDDPDDSDDPDDGDDSETGDGDGTGDEETSPDTNGGDDGNGSDGESGSDNGDEDDGGTGGDGGTESGDDTTEPGEGDDNESGDNATELGEGNDNESGDNATKSGEDDDSIPGFTTGAGVVSGALGLEWLRREAGADESTGVEESIE